MTDHTSRRVRVGAVSYLNSKPLIEDLTAWSDRAELILDYPSRLADDLAAGRLEVALIPSIECLRRPGYEIVSDACVAARGPVMSVKLYSRVPMGEIVTLALDVGSRTSAALAQIMLWERFGVRPQLEPLPFEQSISQTKTDAILVIGDRAIHQPSETFVATWDLGQEWYDWTGLPFVFAMWVTRKDADLGDVEEALCRSRDVGVDRLEQIASRESAALGIPPATAFEYLSVNLHFRLGSPERTGLNLFRELAEKSGHVPQGVEFVYRHYSHTR